MSSNQDARGLDLRSYLDQIVKDPLDKFNVFTTWTENDKKEFKVLLDNLKKPYDSASETKKEKGDRLERLVEFIIRKTYFFEIYKNVHTETNEIDEVIVLSNRGKQAIHSLDLSRDLIPIDQDLFLGECKNYSSNLSVTYVGKFYSLLSVTGVLFGIIFTQKGLTGTTDGFKDAYGLAKILRIIEKSKGRDLFILTFTMEDYEKMLAGTTFFDLVKAKKLELQLASDYRKFIMDNKHEAEEQIQSILEEYK